MKAVLVVWPDRCGIISNFNFVLVNISIIQRRQSRAKLGTVSIVQSCIKAAVVSRSHTTACNKSVILCYAWQFYLHVRMHFQ